MAGASVVTSVVMHLLATAVVSVAAVDMLVILEVTQVALMAGASATADMAVTLLTAAAGITPTAPAEITPTALGGIMATPEGITLIVGITAVMPVVAITGVTPITTIIDTTAIMVGTIATATTAITVGRTFRMATTAEVVDGFIAAP
jgi:hypothetical protein